MPILVLQEKQNKIRIVLIAFCLAAFQFVSAQNDFHKELSVGVNGSLMFSSVSFTPRPLLSQNKLIRAAGGLTVRYISEKNIGLQFELNYSQRGWKECDSEHPDKRYARALNYLEFPVFTHLYCTAGKYFRLVTNLGPQIGYLLNEKILEFNVLEDTENEWKSQYYTQKAQRRFDWGLCFGGGIEFRTGIGNFILDGRYYYGLSDIFNNSRADRFASSSNQIISVKLTYLFYQ